MATCGICKRPLDQEGDELSLDCGGDCLGCIREIEASLGDQIAPPPAEEPGRTE